ncbi:MAG: D-alanine--D-alanine ligase [Acidimicrobiia bacterium]|nr:D-alanine--D-alanine ligase [Acidimicrobiia bacterium]
MPKQTVAVLFGGRSVEHEVSIISAHQVMDALEVAGYTLLPVFIDKAGAWHAGRGLYNLRQYSVPGFRADAVRDSHRVSLSPDTSIRQLVLHPFGAKGFFYRPPELWADVFFPVLHGTFGEDGRLQGLFELAGVPYAGSGVEASAIGMDKIKQKDLYRAAGLPVLDCEWVSRQEWSRAAGEFTRKVEARFPYPVIVKPSSLGSSIAVARCLNGTELAQHVNVAMQFDDRVMAEPALVNFKEVNCSVTGPPCEASVCEMPSVDGELLTFDAKYKTGSKKGITGMSKSGMASLNRIIPAPIGPVMTARVQEYAKQAFQAIGCHGIARIDFLLASDHESLYVNEINTMPGSLSFYLWEASGLRFDQLVTRMVEGAIDRHKQKAPTQFTVDVNLLSGGKPS